MITQTGTESELIYRKAAIDAVKYITSSMSVWVNTDECHGMKRMQRQAVIELANLPPAQPHNVNNDLQNLAEEIAQFKRCVKSENSDYLTGYLCALSAVEGMIAERRQDG